MDRPSEPTPRKPRRWYSPRVRELLVLVAILGAPMGWWASQAQLQRRAVAMIESANGSVVYDHEVLKRTQNASMDTLTPEGERRQLAERFKRMGSVPPPEVKTTPDPSNATQTRMQWAIRNLGVDFVHDVVQVIAIGSKPGERFEPALLENLPRLERLNLQLKLIGDQDLVHLAGLRDLRALCLTHTKITDAGLVHLRNLDQLEDLILTRNGNGFTDVGLAHLGSLKSLRDLEISGPMITDEGLSSLRGLTELRTLWLTDSPKVTYRGIAELERALPQLKIKHPLTR